jgi:ABC-2 type transport system ATP-binding protein
MTSEAVIAVQGLSKTYRTGFTKPGIRALSSLSLTVRKGEVFGLLGPNGAGKTTLVKILLGLVRPTAGSAALLDLPVSSSAARRRIGYLPEDHRFPGFLTARQMMDTYGQLSGVSPELRKQRIPELLEMVDMSRWADTRIKKYSKGMMQRVGLAQTLVNDPAAVLLDEPTDGVDPIGRKHIREVLVQLRDQGKTVFLNSHLLSEVEQVCTRIAILNNGELIREGSIDELTSFGHGYELRCTRMTDELRARLGEAIADTSVLARDGMCTYRIQADDRADLNAIIDALRSAGVEIESIQPARSTLEDYFVKVVEER